MRLVLGGAVCLGDRESLFGTAILLLGGHFNDLIWGDSSRACEGAHMQRAGRKLPVHVG